MRSLVETARESPAFALFLAALAALPFRWLSPLESVYERAGWVDVFIAGAVMLWLAEHAAAWRAGERPRVRPWHWALAAYVLLAFVSAGFSANRSGAVTNALLTAELGLVAVLAADFAADLRRRAAIALVVLAGALVTAALAAIGLILFYAGVRTGLLGGYGDLVASDLYARVTAGFYSPPLLGSYCIFASAVVAMRGNGLSAAWRRSSQIVLAGVVISTFSRAIIGFFAALVARVAAGHPVRSLRIAATAAVVGATVAMAMLTIEPTSLAGGIAREGFGYRHDSVSSSWRTLGDHPIVGLGPGELPGIGRGVPVRAHLTPLNIAATLGVPALVALILAVALIWRDRPRPTDIALWAGLLGLAIDGLGQDIDHFRHVWILLGLAAGTPAGGGGKRPWRVPEGPCEQVGSTDQGASCASSAMPHDRNGNRLERHAREQDRSLNGAGAGPVARGGP